jgi:hypothetical protein
MLCHLGIVCRDRVRRNINFSPRWEVPRTRTGTDSRTGTRRRRTGRLSGDSRGIVDQITQLVNANESLQRENRELVEENQRLRGELMQIDSALGRLTGAAPRGRRGRRGGELVLPSVAEARPRRQRKPITDPEALERRKQALVRARAVRAERLAAARAATGGNGASEGE